MRSASSTLHSLILRSKSLDQAKQLHAQTLVFSLSTSPLLLSSLVLSYSLSGDPSSSRLLLSASPPLPLLHNSLIRALSAAHLPTLSLLAYNSLVRSNLAPDDRTYPLALKACADSRSLHKGGELHSSVTKLGLGSDAFVGNTLLSFYGACGELGDARKVFDEMRRRDVVSWNSIVSANLGNGRWLDCMGWFRRMVRSRVEVNEVSVVSVLPAAGATGSEGFGMGVHGYATKLGLASQTRVSNAIVDMYGKCGEMDGAVRVFCGMKERNEVSWNSVLGNLVHVGMFEDALRVFRDMLVNDEAKPNTVTISSLLPALVELGLFRLGKEVHGYCVRIIIDSDVYVANSLIDMYAKCGCMNKATDVFDGMKIKNVVSWNAMIANLAQNGAHLEAIEHVIHMQNNGECPNSVTFTNVLPACARISSLTKGKEIHALSIRDGSYLDLFVSNALIDMYAKCGRLHIARRVFEVSDRDQVSYNTLIVGYSQSSCCSEALHLFLEMQLVGLRHDVVSFMGALSACGNLSAFKQGKEIHCLSIRKFLDTHIFVSNSLLDFYIKSGRIDIARKIFDRIPKRDVASWNAMILGYGVQGELEMAIGLFDVMESEGIEHDHVSFIAVLSACSHGGLVERGKKYFQKMLARNLKPMQMHYASMVDTLGRAGLLKEAEELIKGMPYEADSNVWGALLGACRVHGDIEMGRRAAERLFVLKPEHCGYYVLMANMYAEVGRWEEADKIRGLMRSRSAKKTPGRSWIEPGDGVQMKTPGRSWIEPGDGVQMEGNEDERMQSCNYLMLRNK